MFLATNFTKGMQHRRARRAEEAVPGVGTDTHNAGKAGLEVAQLHGSKNPARSPQNDRTVARACGSGFRVTTKNIAARLSGAATGCARNARLCGALAAAFGSGSMRRNPGGLKEPRVRRSSAKVTIGGQRTSRARALSPSQGKAAASALRPAEDSRTSILKTALNEWQQIRGGGLRRYRDGSGGGRASCRRGSSENRGCARE